MITPAMLEEWRKAKNLAVTSLTLEPEVQVAMQEMYIEAKALRKDNLKLLNYEDLLLKALMYVIKSKEDHYLTPELEELYDEITVHAHRLKFKLENQND